MNLVKQDYSEMTSIGKTFAESGMFADVKSAAQAIVKIIAGAEMGIPAFASMSGIHIIQGKPTVGAGLLAARVKGSGKYDYEVKELTETVCSIDFKQDGKVIGNSTFTIADAKKAGTKNLEKFPKNMLFARAMSNGVKFYTPDLFNGPVYVPGEMEDVQQVEDVPHVEVPAKDESTDEALKSLSFCETVAELKEWKTLIPEHVRKRKAVADAAKVRFMELQAKEVANA